MPTPKILIPVVSVIVSLASIMPGFAQTATTIGELFDRRKYQEIVELIGKQPPASAEEFYYVGYSYFQLGDDTRAIEAYDKAIEAGLDEGFIFFFKGLALRYNGRPEEALEEFTKAVQREPHNQRFASEKAFTYYKLEKLDSALALFIEAKRFPNTYQMPWYMVPHLYHLNGQLDTALTGFYVALENISPDNEYYVSTLLDIGLLEFTYTRNYAKSVLAYRRALEQQPDEYIIHPKLLKACYADKQYELADSVFHLVETAYEQNRLPDDYSINQMIPVAEFTWNGRKAAVYRSLVMPEILKPLYTIYLLTAEGDRIDRTLLVERTFAFGDSDIRFLLCESTRSEHRTYPYGWEGKDIAFEDLLAKAIMIFEGADPAASSQPGE